jgi:hypothetical protein
MSESAEYFRRILVDATAAIDSAYFLLPVAYVDAGA